MSFFTKEALPILDGMFSTAQEESHVENKVPVEAKPKIRR